MTLGSNDANFERMNAPAFKGLIYARNAAAVAAFAVALVLLGALTVKALGNISYTMIEAHKSVVIHQEGY